MKENPTKTCCDCGKPINRHSQKRCRPCLYEFIRKNRNLHARFKHGFSGLGRSPEYASWQHAKDRCFNPKNKNFIHYGKRGITMCDEWRNNFLSFLRDVGNRPSLKHSLDRINNNGNYEPGNVRWANQVQQTNNSRKAKPLTWNSITLSRREWCKKLGLKPRTLESRIRIGWSIEKIMATQKLPLFGIIAQKPLPPQAQIQDQC